MKLYRKLEDGVNPDPELIRYLSEVRGFAQVPAFLGSIAYRQQRSAPRVLGLLVANVPNEGDAWSYTLDSVGRFYERVLAQRPQSLELSLLSEAMGGVYPERARLLAQRTAEMHLEFAADVEDPAFAPEPFTSLDRRSLYQSMRNSTRRMFELVRRRIGAVAEVRRAEVASLLALEGSILERMEDLMDKIDTMRIRVHGDYHLGQVLHTGKDFVIVDFEGEPARSLGERRMKRSALRDVAGMMRSFHYAAYASLWQESSLRSEDITLLEPWAEAWARQVQNLFLEAYLEITRHACFIPKDITSLRTLLDAHLLEKASYEIVYELNNRPDWVILPARGISSILRTGGRPAGELGVAEKAGAAEGTGTETAQVAGSMR
jgi:maltose alpha-D-glucosyltransferase / alpha-amylase